MIKLNLIILLILLKEYFINFMIFFLLSLLIVPCQLHALNKTFNISLKDNMLWTTHFCAIYCLFMISFPYMKKRPLMLPLTD
jgi:hypothetical protein